jgi:hypothetical protein
MNRLTVGNIAVEAQRAVRLSSQAYGDRVIRLIDDLIATKTLSHGGTKELLRTREIFCDYFYFGNDRYLNAAVVNLMGFAFLERAR